MQRVVDLSTRATAFKDAGRLEEALGLMDECLKLAPKVPELHYNRANILVRLARLVEAIDAYGRALKLRPDFVEALYNRANALMECRAFGEAIPELERLLKLKPDAPFAPGWLLFCRLQCCDWKGLDTLKTRLMSGLERGANVAVPFGLLSLFDEQPILDRATDIYLQHVARTVRNPPTPIHQREPGGRIRIGYFSADFHDHATMHLMLEMLEAHDRARFEIIGYSFGPDRDDAWRRRTIAAMDQFHEVRAKPEAELVAFAREARLDIAVDLKGYTTDSRPGIFLSRVAPIQVSYLGYPGTTRMKSMDYILADRHVMPTELWSSYPEKVVRLPHSYQVNCRHRSIAEKPIDRPSLGLPESAFVFCSFNANNKITPEVFSRWIRILLATPDSVLWLLAPEARARTHLAETAARLGLDPNRLIFASKLPVDEHLQRLRCADLMLDTFPYNAHTTASDALRMGLPIVTLAGRTFASRVCASLLETARVPELITTDGEAYEHLAVSLARDTARYAAIKARLLCATETPLYDGALAARAIESAFLEMRARLDSGRPPAHFEVT